MSSLKQKLTLRYSLPLLALALSLTLGYLFAENQLSQESVDIESLKWLHRILLIAGMLAVLFAGLFIFRPMIHQIVEKQEALIASNSEISASEEEMRQNMEELEATQEELQKNQKRLIENEQVMKKFIEKLRLKENELKERNEELLTSEEELRQQQEEIMAQREIVEKSNQRLQENEALLKKFIGRLKNREQELSSKNEELLTSEEELRQQHEEIMAQREAVEKSNIRLQQNEELLRKFIEKLKVREKELSEKNEFIQLSIQSAEQIQASILPSASSLSSIFPQHCLFYRPKDIVSGDFYWASEHGRHRLIGAIDCTGHGISGAFISLLGYSILREIIYRQESIYPDEVLQKLNQGISDYLRFKEHKSNYGMDASFCLIESDEENSLKTVYFSGAKQGLYHIRQGEVSRIKGDRSSLGGHYTKKAVSFTRREFKASPGDTLYLATDGFIDQANNERKRYGRLAFEELLQQIHSSSMERQTQLLADAFEQHRKQTPQRDDVTILGIKL